MDLSSAVQFLIGYEASLKLAPGQKPPPPSPSLSAQLVQAAATIEQELTGKEPEMRFSGLSPSVWSDWPLCCGLDLATKELKAARSLPPSLLRERGLLSLFLALQSCAEGGVDRANVLAYGLLAALSCFLRDKKDDPAPFPSAHLAARVGHRLVNADGVLNFEPDLYGDNLFAMFDSCIWAPVNILMSATLRPDRHMAAVPHEAAGLSLAKEMAAMLDALCAAERNADTGSQSRFNRLPLLICCKVLNWLFYILGEMPPVGAGDVDFLPHAYREASALPAYDLVLLLQCFSRDVKSGFGHEVICSDHWPSFLESCRSLFWIPLSDCSFIARLRPADGYTVMRLGLEDLGRQGLDIDGWLTIFFNFCFFALHSGLVRPELILRLRPQLLEGLVEGLARGRIPPKASEFFVIPFLTLIIRSPAVGFHLKKFFSRSGCLQAVQEVSDPFDCRWNLITLIGPRAAQSGLVAQWTMQGLLEAVADSRSNISDTANDVGHPLLASICDMIIRDFTLDLTPGILRESRHAQTILQYLSELAEEIAASKRPHGVAQYGVLMVVGLGEACLTMAGIIARGLKDIREAGPKGRGGMGPGRGGPSRARSQEGLRARLMGMETQLSLLRRRVLHELLPLAEAREAALWEGVREEEVVAALKGEA